MRFTRYILIVMLLNLTFCPVYSQTRAIDSLKKNIRDAGSKEKSKKAIFDLCELGYILHPDTLMFYAEMAKNISIKQFDLHGQLLAMFYQSGALTTKGLIDSSMNVANRCLAIVTSKIKDPQLEANLYNQKGRCFMRKSQYKEAIDMGYQVIKTAEKANDVLLQIKGKTLLGWAYLEIGQTEKSLSWHLKAMRTTSDSTVLEKYGILFANIALNYNALGKTDSAFYFINKAISSSRKYENLFALSNSLAIQAQLFVRSGKPAQAEGPLEEVVKIRKLIGDPFYIVSDMAQLGLYYAGNNQPQRGISICNEGIAIAKQYQIDTKLLFLYSSLAENYKAAGNTTRYAEVLEDIIELKDSVYQNNSAQTLAEMQTKYDLQKKENLIIRQKLDIQKKNYFFYGLLLLVFFTLLVSWQLFRGYRRKQNAKLLAVQEDEKIRSAIAVTQAQENERKRIAADLHDNLGAYAAAIANNVEQIGLQHDHKTALQELNFNTQSIVSQLNDTIWVLKKDNLSLTAISDRIKVFIQRISPSYPQINIDVVEQISTDILLPPTKAFHLFQIAKEAINNSIKHSTAKHVRVYLESSDSWKIIVSDDGIGIHELDKKMGNGSGLLNMKSRSKKSGWQIVWQENDSGGTSVVITPTTN